MARAPRMRNGSTLIEMLISVALLGILSSVVALAMRRFERPNPSDPTTIIADTLERVLTDGTPVTLQFTVNSRPAMATVNPDGSIVADTVLQIDRFTGRNTHAR